MKADAEVTLRQVSIAGIGQVQVGEHWDLTLRQIGYQAIKSALDDAGMESADAVYVGNMLAESLNRQAHLGALVADFSGLRGVEAFRVEAADASGAAAFRAGVMAVASGMCDTVVVLGIEKMTDALPAETQAALALGMDREYEANHGLSQASLAALMMRRYMHEFGATLDEFAAFPVTAHENGVGNPFAMFRRAIKRETYLRAGPLAEPVNLFDSAPICDGAAAVVLTTRENASKLGLDHPIVHVIGSAVATDAVAVHDRKDPLFLEAAYLSSQRAYLQAGVTPEDIDLFELHDSFSVIAAMSLEACGFANKGEGARLAYEGGIALNGRIPISKMGGLKARGNPVGATGVYQIVEVALQLRGEAGDNQIADARMGMAQNLGGTGGTAVTHILASE